VLIAAKIEAKICESDSGGRRDDGRKNEFSALIIAKMAIKVCESDSRPCGGEGEKVGSV
jgi:hypothetical protein